MKVYKGEDITVDLNVFKSGNECVLRTTRIKTGQTDKHWDKVFKSNSRHSSRVRAETAMMTKLRTYLNKKGYYRSKEAAINGINDIDSCLLLSKYVEDDKVKIAMPKIDGIRCRWKRHPDSHIWPLSRGGKDITGLTHMNMTQEWDCELYIPDSSLENIQSVVTGSGDKSELIACIFDVCIPDMPFKERIKLVHEYIKPSSVYMPVPFEVVRTKEEKDLVHRKHLKQGFEGTVYRDPEGLYECKRTNNTQKRKPFLEEEFKIIDWHYDTKDRIIFELQSPAGTFDVVPSWTHEQRVSPAYACQLIGVVEHNSLIGKYATVRYQDTTAKGIPKFCNVITMRVTKEDGRIIY